VCYDGLCNICTSGAGRFGSVLRRRGFALATLQEPWVRQRLGLSADQPLEEMFVLLPDGRRFGGADALLYIARSFWWAWPLRLLTCLPAGKSSLNHAYRWVARHRHRLAGHCSLPEPAHRHPEPRS
jgi:predicted DCC family thiol-disulfide oxidoreductase YuxK